MNTNNKLLPLALIALASFTGCTSNAESNETAEATSTPVSSATSIPGNYIELNGAPGLTEDDLQPADREAVAQARIAGSPLYVRGVEVFWLDATISYAERVLVEEEAAKTSNDEFIRSVEGFGSGELTFYRHDVAPYSLKVAQQ